MYGLDSSELLDFALLSLMNYRGGQAEILEHHPSLGFVDITQDMVAPIGALSMNLLKLNESLKLLEMEERG